MSNALNKQNGCINHRDTYTRNRSTSEIVQNVFNKRALGLFLEAQIDRPSSM